ncbi:tyrosine-type recombinase/integrase [Candidatus Ulvibacter alkanivorans]|uniref:tyrosine-type recombinase/integrase n=1 Tax=Candidatus Ulvibacter alkanivorans TaxID=2267620 RepID=UPI000DF3FD93|nr:site-specific integrase [Candidatus Ulvibacter alkanivorans]
MARARLTLDTRKKSKNSDGFYPIVIRIFHRKPRMIRMDTNTSICGWDSINMELKKSANANRDLDCDKVNVELYDKLHAAKSIINELGDTIDNIGVDILIENIKKTWDNSLDSELKKNLSNPLTINEWSKVLISRKLKEEEPGTAKWYKDSISAITKFNEGQPLKFFELTVTFLKEFESEHKAKGNSNNTISSYLRGVRAIYNSAIKEDKYIPEKNPFLFYKIPTTRRTKKKALPKENFATIRELDYPVGSNLFHTKNYLLSMFNCRGMNLIDLAKLKVRDIKQGRIFYGRSKTDDPLSVKITKELRSILDYYTVGKEPNDFIFPIGYDGSVATFKKYRSDRRLVNKLCKIIAKDANLNVPLTSYYVRHSWATIAKNMGISTEIISEGLGHHTLRTTEIYLKSFDNEVLDDANELIVA